MRIVHIGYFYGERNTGGAAIAATRLHRALRSAGVDSIFVCYTNTSPDDSSVVEFPPVGSLRRKWNELKVKAIRNLWRLLPGHKARSLHIVHTGIAEFVLRLKPDIVHVHWFTDECASLEEIKSIKCPIIMHLHDMWMLNAFDPYPHADRRYIDGFNKSNSHILERSLWRRKLNLVQSKDVAFIGPSNWVKGRADESAVAKGRRNFHVPYFQDDKFQFNKLLRSPHKMFRILFGAYGGRSNSIKGFDDLVCALKLLPKEMQDKCEVLVFGEVAESYNVGDVSVRFLGVAKSAEQLVKFYHCADIFAFPSREETWGQTKSEALLCGLPVVAFDRTACAEGIEQGCTGWIAPDGDIDSFAQGIQHFFGLWSNGNLEASHSAIARSARHCFDNSAVLSKLMNVYEAIA